MHISAELAKSRVDFRERMLRTALCSIDDQLDADRLHFLSGLPDDASAGALQRHGDWTMGFYSFASVVARDAARAAADELGATTRAAPLSELILPIISAVDERALETDIHLGRDDQVSLRDLSASFTV